MGEEARVHPGGGREGPGRAHHGVCMCLYMSMKREASSLYTGEKRANLVFKREADEEETAGLISVRLCPWA